MTKDLTKLLLERANTACLDPFSPEDFPADHQEIALALNIFLSRVRRDAERNKRFSADAAHELRTPLTALKTQARLALEMTDPYEQKRAIENVAISVNRSIHVVQQLLTLSRLDHEAKLNDVTLVNLETICAEMIAFIYPLALEKDVDIELCNHTNKPYIMGNDASLGILLRNLLDNAIRYTSTQGKVSVMIEDITDTILLRIIDDGPGIAEEYKERVFDRFFRILGTRQTGSGLGLAIVKQITDLHKATISLGNISERGLCVSIVFKKPYETRPHT